MAASKWAETFFQIDQQRDRSIIRGLKMMTPDAAVALVEQVKQSGVGDTATGGWQTVWKPRIAR